MIVKDCKICGGTVKFFTSVDRAKHCNLQIPQIAYNIDNAIEYHRCLQCSFIFTEFLDSYSLADLQTFIYNEDYVKFDPLYPKIRPETNARFLRSLVRDSVGAAERPRILDYGAGSGLLSRLMADEFPVENYDPLNLKFDRLPAGQFDLIFSAEVVEHMPFPRVFVDDWSACLSEFGCVIFSTKVQPDDIDVIRGDWWYLGPRNGHVSLYSRQSLQALCSLGGLIYEGLTEDWHLAYRDPRHIIDRETLHHGISLLPTGFIMV